MTNSKIEWTESTWNPITGCSKISEGCEHCYAEKMVKRFPHIYPNGFKPTFYEKRLSDPLKWKKPRRIFVCSMGDLFHEDVPLEWIAKVFKVMKDCPQHTFLLLTKRPENALKVEEQVSENIYLPNVWIGVTIESSDHLIRGEILHFLRFKHKFVSLEPLLSRIRIEDLFYPRTFYYSVPNGSHWDIIAQASQIEWVIVGGETGPGAREMKSEWVRDIRDKCIENEVPFFFKKWGGARRSENERLLDGREWNEFPEVMR